MLIDFLPPECALCRHALLLCTYLCLLEMLVLYSLQSTHHFSLCVSCVCWSTEATLLSQYAIVLIVSCLLNSPGGIRAYCACVPHFMTNACLAVMLRRWLQLGQRLAMDRFPDSAVLGSPESPRRSPYSSRATLRPAPRRCQLLERLRRCADLDREFFRACFHALYTERSSNSYGGTGASSESGFNRIAD